MKASIESKIVLGFVVSIITLAGLGWFSFRAITSLITTENWVSHTHEVIGTLESGLAILTDAENSQRAYLLTVDERFLQDSQNAQAKVEDWLKRMQLMVADNPEQQKRLSRLEDLIRRRLAILNNRIQIRQQQGLQAVANAVASREGKEVMMQVWQGISEMKQAENILLEQREASAQSIAENSLIIVITGSSLACLVGFLAVLVIRRDLKLRSEALEERDRFFSLSRDLLCIADFKGYFTRVNSAWQQTLGYTGDELLQKPFVDFVHPDDVAATVAESTKLAEGNESIHFENRYRCKDGSYRWLEWSSRADLPHKLIYASARDITNEKRLQQIHLQFRSLFESLPGLYVVLTPDFKIVAVSDAYLEATLTKREEIMGRVIFDVFPDDPNNPEATGVANLRASLERVLKNGVLDTMPIQRYDIRRPDGNFEERFWSPVSMPAFGSDREIEYIIHRVEDVTDFMLRRTANPENADLRTRMEQMEAEVFRSAQQVQAVNQELRDSNKELEAFSYSVSHDLRAPLRHIDGFVRLLEKQATQLDQKGQRYLTIIAESARQMGALIDDLLVFSRMGRTELRHTKVAAQSLVHEAVDSTRMDSAKRNIEWKIGELPEIEVDSAMMRQVWINLIANAVKYSRPRDPAKIEVGCQDASDDEFVFFVRDNGVGFDMQYAHKLFGVFQRLHSSDEFEGTGIGLANVGRIVHRHGGRVWAEGAVGQGATFYFSIPKTKTEKKG